MDPITAFSLAVNVVTVIESTIKAGKTLWELYQSSSGFTKETEDLLQATDQWNSILTDCSQALGGLQAAPSAETAAQDCRRLIQAIEDVLKTLKVQKRSSITASAKSYFQANRQRRALETLETRLQRTMENLRTSLAIATK